MYHTKKTRTSDTHKNGWSPKGSSVLVCMPMLDYALGSVSLAYYSMYTQIMDIVFLFV